LSTDIVYIVNMLSTKVVIPAMDIFRKNQVERLKTK